MKVLIPVTLQDAGSYYCFTTRCRSLFQLGVQYSSLVSLLRCFLWRGRYILHSLSKGQCLNIYNVRPNSFIVKHYSFFSEVLVFQINNCFGSGHFPKKLKFTLVPVFQKDQQNLSFNYRPISIVPTISKIYEWTMSLQIKKFLNPVEQPLSKILRFPLLSEPCKPCPTGNALSLKTINIQPPQGTLEVASFWNETIRTYKSEIAAFSTLLLCVQSTKWIRVCFYFNE